MRRLAGAVIGVSVVAAVLAATSGAAVQSPTGDTCTASGNGTSTYTVTITLPSNAAQQGGFAFGAPGVKVANIIGSGTEGTFSTMNLPANTTGEWLLSSPAVLGATLTAVLTTSSPVTGSFTVVTATSPPSQVYFASFLCGVETGTATASNAFTAAAQATYDSATGAWHELVTIPAQGTVRSAQEVVTAGAVASRPLIQGDQVSSTTVGKVALTLRPTGDGKAALKTSGSIKLKLSITFLPKDGKSANKIISLTLRK